MVSLFMDHTTHLVSSGNLVMLIYVMAYSFMDNMLMFPHLSILTLWGALDLEDNQTCPNHVPIIPEIVQLQLNRVRIHLIYLLLIMMRFQVLVQMGFEDWSFISKLFSL